MRTSTVEGSPGPEAPLTAPAPAPSQTAPSVAVAHTPAPPLGCGSSDPSRTDDDRDRSKLALVLVLVGAVMVCLVVGLVLFRADRTHHLVARSARGAHAGSAHAATTVSVAISATSLVNPSASPAGPVIGSKLTPSPVAPTSTAAPTTTVSTAVAFGAASASPSSVSCPDPQASTTTTAFVQPEVHLSWTALHATSVDLSVDGPGVYQPGLPASGSYDFSFSCAGPHTLLLTAHGSDGSSATRTFVITSHE